MPITRFGLVPYVQLPEKKYGAFGGEPSDELRAADDTIEGMSKPPKEIKDERGGSKEKTQGGYLD